MPEKAAGETPPSLPVPRDARGGRRPEDVALGFVVRGARLGVRAGRVAILPFRIAGRVAGPARVDRATGSLGVDGRAASTQGRALVEAAVDRTLAGPLPDAFAQKLVEHRVIERIVADVMQQIDLDALVTNALDDEHTREQFQRVLENPALERLAVSAVESKLTAELAEKLAASPQVRAAIARQTTSFAGELVGVVRTRLRQLDDRLFPRTAPEPDVRYGGIATRAVALTIDALLAHIGVLVPAAAVALISSLAGGLHADWLVDTILGIGWFVVVAGYFVFFWTVLGRTPGLALLGLNVADPRGAAPSLPRSIVRLVGLLVSIAVVFAGFLPVLFDGRRRGLADFAAGTTVQSDR